MRWLAACGVIAALLDVLFILWLGAQDPTYSHVRQYFSELGERGRPGSTMVSLWYVAWGALFLGFTFAFDRAAKEQGISRLGSACLFVIALISVIVGIFPLDPGGTAVTVAGQIHVIAGGWIATPVTILAPLLCCPDMRRFLAWRGSQWFSLATSLLLAILAVWLALCHYGDLDRTICAPGLAQRMFTGVFYLWVAAVTVGLWKRL